jgi:hypothetical protein
MLAWFEAAYKAVILRSGKDLGTNVSLREVLAQLQVQPHDNLADDHPRQSLGSRKYAVLHFRGDLARLIEAGTFVSPSGRRLRLLPTAFAKEGLAVRTRDGVRYFGSLAFSTEGS